MARILKETAIVTCEKGHVIRYIIRHSSSQKKGGRKLEVPKVCVRCGTKIVRVDK